MDLNIHSLDALIYSHCKSVCALHAHFWEKGSVPRWRVNAVVIIIAATFTSKKNLLPQQTESWCQAASSISHLFKSRIFTDYCLLKPLRAHSQGVGFGWGTTCSFEEQ